MYNLHTLVRLSTVIQGTLPASLVCVLQSAHAHANAADSITQSHHLPGCGKIPKSAMVMQLHCNVLVSVLEVRLDSQTFSSPPYTHPET